MVGLKENVMFKRYLGVEGEDERFDNPWAPSFQLSGTEVMLKLKAKPQAWSCLGRGWGCIEIKKHYIKNGLHRWTCHFLTSCWLCALCLCLWSLCTMQDPMCRVRRSWRRGIVTSVSVWKVLGNWGESEVHHVILVLRDCGAGGRNGSSACQQVTESTRPWCDQN